MKRTKRHIQILSLLSALLLTACYDFDRYENVAAGEQPVSHDSSVDSSYINLHIVNNATTTRATAAEENAIYDGILCIFEGTSEATCTLRTATVIDQLINNPGNSSSITVTQRLAGTHKYNGNKLYALVLLNTTSTGFNVQNNMLYLNGSSLSGKTRAEIQSMTINSVGSPDEHVGLYMTNTVKDDNTVLRIIYPNDPSKQSYLYDTPEAAAGGKRQTINVERAAAKVTVTNTATTVSSFKLDNDDSRHPIVHRMTWALHNYNKVSYAIRNGSTAAENWATSVTGEDIPIAFVNSGTDAFDLYQQQSFSDGESVYIAENTTSTVNDQTQVFVEVQLKEGSFLLGDCYKYELEGNVIFFTSAEKFIQYYKAGWKDTFSQNSAYTIIKDKSADEVFKYYSFVINNDGTVTVTITNDSFTDAEKNGLSTLSSILSGTLKGYRDGKMYFTYKIKHDNTPAYGVVRNNAYNLTFTGVPGIGDPVPTPIVTP